MFDRYSSPDRGRAPPERHQVSLARRILVNPCSDAVTDPTRKLKENLEPLQPAQRDAIVEGNGVTPISAYMSRLMSRRFD